MNTYYLKKFRKKAYNSIMIQYYDTPCAYTIVWRLTEELFRPMRLHHKLDSAKDDLRELRMEIMATLIENKRREKLSKGERKD